MSANINMPPQEVVNLVYEKLSKQGHRSMLSFHSGVCAYRGKDGAKCAVGWLIPDEDYVPKMDGADGSGLYTLKTKGLVTYEGAPEIPGLVDGYHHFLSELQMVHDNISDARDFQEELDESMMRFCREYGLTFPGGER